MTQKVHYLCINILSPPYSVSLALIIQSSVVYSEVFTRYVPHCVEACVLYCPLNAGLRKQWFLPMMRGEMLPKMPTEPPAVHIRAGETVPYTPEEQADRTAAYKSKKATWDKTMKVIYVCGLY